MKILIVSDTHRSNALYLQLVEKYEPLDMIIHCGDIEGSELTISKASDCPVHMVAGNNDFFSQIPMEDEFYIGKYKVFLTHGHHYYISMGNELLKDEARSRGADIVMYGHTHRPVIEQDGNILVINPGSLTYPRQEGRRPSYVLMELDKKGEISTEIKFLP